jgi:monooxygenase
MKADRTEHFDVLVIGAGISGIGAACYLSRLVPPRRFTVLEAAGTFGGTWTVNRYPRSGPTATCTPSVTA